MRRLETHPDGRAAVVNLWNGAILKALGLRQALRHRSCCAGQITSRAGQNMPIHFRTRFDMAFIDIVAGSKVPETR